MKKLRNIFIIFGALFFAVNVNAECDYEFQAKLNSEAATIKAVYTEELGKFDDSVRCNDGTTECPGYSYFKVSVLNLSDNFYINVKGDKFSKTLTYEDIKEGIVSFDLENIMDTHTFSFDVYPTTKTGCAKKKIRTFYLTTPRYNEFYSYGFCQDNPDYYLCEKYVTFEKMDITDFMDKYESYQESKKNEEERLNRNFFEKVWDFIKEHKEIFIAPGVTIVIVGGVLVVLTVKRRKDII